MTITIEDVRRAAAAIAGEVAATPTVAASRLSDQLGVRLFLKLENLHHTGSFKERGALNKLKSLTPDEARVGVIAMSAGNHAQGVAHHAGRLGIPATIVMPETTPFTKIERTEAYGARVVLHGETLADAEKFAHDMARRDGLTFVHPYDDEKIIAGQGTVGLEMLSAVPDIDVLIVPIGGGGLIAGIATAAKAIRPSIEIVGVEAELYPSMKHGLEGKVPNCTGATIAEGIAVKSPGRLTMEIVRTLVDDIVLVGETILERAVERMVTAQKIVAEGAGAAGLAALLAEPDRYAGRKVGIVVCGGNIDSRILSSILMRGLVRDGRLVRLRIAIADVPGALARVAQLLGQAGGNIVEVHHQRLFHNVPVRITDLDVVVETRDPHHADSILETLRRAGFPVELMHEVS